MKVGLAFDKQNEAVNAVAQILSDLGNSVHMIGGTVELVQMLAKGERWDFVFNMTKGTAGHGSQAQVPTVLDAFKIPYSFSEPLPVALSADLSSFCNVVGDLGLPVRREQNPHDRHFAVAMLGTPEGAVCLAVRELGTTKARNQGVDSRVCSLAEHAWSVMGLRDAGLLKIAVDEHESPYIESIDPTLTFDGSTCLWTKICTEVGNSRADLVHMVFANAVERYGLIAKAEASAKVASVLASKESKSSTRTTSR